MYEGAKQKAVDTASRAGEALFRVGGWFGC